MHGPNEPEEAGWEWAEESERQMFEEAQRLLKEDAEAYNRWIDEVVRAGLWEREHA